MVKNFKLIIVITLISFCLSGCAFSSDNKASYSVPEWTDESEQYPKEDGDLRIIHLSDVHYFSKRLTDQGEKYGTFMNSLGGLDIYDVEEVLDTAIEKIIDMKPDAVIVSGDLTLNGEKESHIDFAAKMQQLIDEGIIVLVIPGNHDINSPYAREVYDTGVQVAENITPQEFAEIYSACGYQNALYKDTNSLSYVAEISKDCWALMLDTCIYKDDNVQVGGNLNYETRNWVYEMLDLANEKGVKIFSSSHHNLLTHNPLFVEDYVLMNSSAFVKELENAGAFINLTGHMHCKHIVSDGKLTDAAIEATSVWPHLYGQLDIKQDGSYTYNTYSITTEYNSYKYIYDASMNTLGKRVDDFNAPEKEKEAMKYFILNVHTDYFTDTVKEKEFYTSNPVYEDFIKYDAEGVCIGYINSIIGE